METECSDVPEEHMFYAKEDTTRQLETCSPFGCYQYHVNVPEQLTVSAQRQFIHIFPIKPVSNASEVFFMDAQPCENDESVHAMRELDHNDSDLALDNESEGEPSDDENDASDSIGNIETEGATLDETQPQPGATHDGQLRQAPTLLQVLRALKDLKDILHPPRKTGAGYKDPKLDPFVRIHLKGMQTMLCFYTNEKLVTYEKWGASALQVAISL